MIIARLSKRMGLVACGAASVWGGYQTKEPKNPQLTRVLGKQ